MMSIFEMFSGYAVTVLGIAVFFWPILLITEFLVRVFLKKASEGVIDIKPLPSLCGSSLWKEISDDPDDVGIMMLVYGILYAASSISLLTAHLNDVLFHEAMMIVLTSAYSAGVWLSGFFLFVSSLFGLYYGVRYTSRLSVKTASVFSAITKHEKDYHKDK